MADKPILFSGPMVRALVAGTKTQTRRALNPQPYVNGFHFDGNDILCHNDWLPPAALLMDKGKGANRYTISNYEDGPEAFGRYRVGDRLYVREHWRTGGQHDHIAPRDLPPEWAHPIEYLADGTDIRTGRFRQAMHMPRWASRITLTVTDVRVERLQDISEADAIAEGYPHNWAVDLIGKPGGPLIMPPREWYREIWEGINGPGSWAANPWVAAYTFTVQTGNIDALPVAA